jgi:uncharacterized protein involved in exopolysaccharide biosynthesis
VESRLEALTAELQVLQAQREAEAARQRDLEHRRDLAWSTYTTLAKKEAEVQVAARSSGSEVRIASLAVPPGAPTRQSLSRNVLLAGALGLTVGALGVFVVVWWLGVDAEEGAARSWVASRGGSGRRKGEGQEGRGIAE